MKKLKKLKKILEFSNLKFGWDSYQAEELSEKSILNACRFLLILFDKNINIDNISIKPSVNGVGFAFSCSNQKLYVEFTNSGRCYYLCYDADDYCRVKEIFLKKDDSFNYSEITEVFIKEDKSSLTELAKEIEEFFKNENNK